MELAIRKLEKKEDYMQAEWLLATAFLNKWDEEEAREKAAGTGSIWTSSPTVIFSMIRQVRPGPFSALFLFQVPGGLLQEP